MPFSLIKKKRVVRLINGKPGENRYNSPIEQGNPTDLALTRPHTTPRRGHRHPTNNVIVIASPRAGDSDFLADDHQDPSERTALEDLVSRSQTIGRRRRGPAAPILLMSFTEESCKPRIDLSNATCGEHRPPKPPSWSHRCRMGPAARSFDFSVTVRNKHRHTQRRTEPPTSKGQAATQLHTSPSLSPHESQRQPLESPVGHLPIETPCTASPKEARERITGLQSNAPKEETPYGRRRCPTQKGLGFHPKNQIRGCSRPKNSTAVPSTRETAPVVAATAGRPNPGKLALGAETRPTPSRSRHKPAHTAADTHTPA